MKGGVIVLISIIMASLVYAVDYPKLTNFVTDNADIIDDEAALADLARLIEQQSTVEIAIVTVPSLEGLDINTYAVELFEREGIGKKDIDNGLLILIAIQERKYRVEVGFGLEGVIPDIEARNIGEKVMAPHFRQGNFDEGLRQGLTVIQALVTNNTEVISKYRMQYRSAPGSRFLAFIPLIFLILIVISMIGVMRSRGASRRVGFFPIFIGGYGGGYRGGGGFGGGFGGFGGGFSGGGGFGGSF